MKRSVFRSLLLSGVLLGVFSSAHAENIQGLKASISDKYVSIEWTPLADQITFDTDGYAVQISQSKEKMRNVDTTEKIVFVKQNESVLSLFAPAAFKNGEDYFVRVYTYIKEVRSLTLTNGSKIVKFRIATSGDKFVSATETLEPNDPVISNTETDSIFSFGKLSVKNPIDTQVDFFWSRPNLTEQDFDGFVVVISKEQSLANPVTEAKVGRDVSSMQVQGLAPETTYYAKGCFVKKGQKFGDSAVETFKTSKMLTEAQKLTLARLLTRGVIKRSDTVVKVDGSSTTAATTTTPASTTTSTSTSSTTTGSSTTSTTTTPSATTSSSSTAAAKTSYTKKEIQDKIKALETELKLWRQRLLKATR